MRVERDEDVERDREPLEPEEQRHQVAGRDEERHPAAGRSEECVVLAHVVAAAIAPRDEHGGEPEAGDEHLRERGELVAAHRLGDEERLMRRAVEDDAREDAGRDESGAAEDDREDAARTRRHEDGAEEADRGSREQREGGRERQPVDLRGRDRGREDHGVTAAEETGAEAGNVCSVIDDGHTERASRISDERDDESELAEAEVEGLLTHGRAAAEVEDPGDQPQRVHRGEHDRDRADGRVAPALLEDAGEDRELTREVGRAGYGKREHADGEDERRERRPPLREPAELGEAVGAGALDQHRGEKEHRRRDEAVADGMEHRPRDAEIVRREDPEHDQAHLGHRRVRDDTAHIGLAEGEDRAVDEARRGKHEHHGAPALDRPGEVPQHDPDQAVDGRLRDHAREQRGDLGRRLGIGGAQPTVEGEQRRLHCECDEEAEEHPLVPARAGVDQVERPL